MKNQLGSIYFDLECSPQESMTYGKHHEATVLEVVNPPYLFCFSYVPLDGRRVRVVSLPDFPLYKREPRNDYEVVKSLHKLLSSSETVVAHNISFDMRIARARFMHHKLPPLKQIKTECTLQMARSLGLFPANTLKELAIYLGVTHKMETSKNLWQKIHFERDPKAWKEMCKYNGVDSLAGKEIYHILKEWLNKSKEWRPAKECPNCSGKLHNRGYGWSLGHRYRRLRCGKCGKTTKGGIIENA